MTLNEFYYWLQGAIEIGEMKGASPEQAKIIVEKSKAVQEQNWFTFTAFHSLQLCDLNEAFAFLRAELQKIFKHEVDPSYEGDQQFQLDVHQGKIEVL